MRSRNGSILCFRPFILSRLVDYSACLAVSFFLSHGLPAQTEKPAPAAVSEQTPLYQQSTATLEQRVDDLLNRMSLEDKAYQLELIARASSEKDERGKRPLKRPDIGGITNATQTSLPAGTSRLGIPPLRMDTSLTNGTTLPLINLGATWNTDLVRRLGAAFSRQQQARGANAIALPLADFLGGSTERHAGWDGGASAFVVGELGHAFAQGIQSNRGVIAVPAYFPAGDGAERVASLQAGERQLRMVYERPFEPLLHGGDAFGVLISPGEIDGVSTVSNYGLLHDMLRTEWKFDGITLAAPNSIQDMFGVKHAVSTPAQAICAAVNSGIDMQWGDYDEQGFAWAIADCVRNGVISMETLNRAVSDVLRVKLRLGLFDELSSGMPAYDMLPNAEMRRELAAQSITLLRNERHTLPLAAMLKSILVVDLWGNVASNKSSVSAPTLAEELRSLLPQAAITESDGKDLKALATVARNAKVVILLIPGEGTAGSNGTGSEEYEQGIVQTVLAANDHAIAIFRGVDTPLFAWSATRVPALLQTWSSAGTDVHSLALALTGSINPGGRLPMALPLAESNAADSQQPSQASVMFPLGFGLSYTTFRYFGLSVETPEPNAAHGEIRVQLTVTNTGKVAGDTVAQLYLHHDISSVATADRGLVGFERIHLDAGETRTVHFLLPRSEFAVWSVAKRWIVEPGPYTLYAGDNAYAELSAHFPIGEPHWAQAAATSLDHWIAAPTLEMKGTPAAEFSEAYELAVRVMEYNLRDGLLEAGEGYGTWTRDTAINAWNAASLLIPDVARRTLWHQTELTHEGAIIGGQYWDKVIWIIAARNYVAITGDREFLTDAYGVALRTLTAMRATQLDSRTGLFRGPAVYGDGVAAYPDPPFNDQHGDNILDYTQGAEIETLSTNSVYYGAYRAAAAMGRLLGASEEDLTGLEADAAKLRNAIEQKLWMHDDNRFGYFLDPDGKVDSTQEALGEALAVTVGVASAQQAHSIFSHAEVTPWGVPCTWQPYHRYFDPDRKVFGRHNGTIWPFINAFWATAASSVGEPDVFANEFMDATRLALRSDDFREIYHPYTGDPYGGFQADRTWDSVRHQTWSATGYLRMLFQGLFGMYFEDAGIRFQPSLPASFGLNSIALHDLTYRSARLSIRIQGSGDRVEQCRLDGVLQLAPFIPATLTGEHTIEITLMHSTALPVTPVGRRRNGTIVHHLQKANASHVSSQISR